MYNNATVVTSTMNKELYRKLDEVDLLQTAALINPDGDGNCGFRAVSYAIFRNQDSWINVKKMMHQNFLTNLPVYEKYVSDTENTNRSPCLEEMYHYMWFDCYTCPQLVADTFKRPVVLLTTNPLVYRCNLPLDRNGHKYDQEGRKLDTLGHHLDSENNFIYDKIRTLFVPFFELDLETVNDPIVLLLTSKHFYLVEQKTDSRTKKPIEFSSWPLLQPMHKVIVDAFPDSSVVDYSDYFLSEVTQTSSQKPNIITV